MRTFQVRFEIPYNKFRLEKKRFEKLVAEAIETLPEKFQKKIQNLNVAVEDEPSDEILRQQGIGQSNTLLGLYHGVPLKNRGVSYTNVLPDKIIIYQKPIERLCRDENEIKEKVREVFRHELGHHFGMSEQDLRSI
ncbi:MAG: hypothetical protein CO162_00780 [bacterium (Candidatus Ratteibacteria) CG_4_9_14_3_um_filter_41_21]|uniref:Metallopeptidase family protein n=3 Tax=Candidatus Ratteibacteria TaxID=2979319 RepID=A0A2M7E9E2_9BACT|nr:MAG: hypothetical protein COS11_02785 [bacterium (Candidatus Ratteibacteria) CG01_land_8_20_14_3_00_40_19]PIW34003.1 MAG: hypothetical protein COW28_01595 [bacterium (Candidatus Ratteibacteria) CG15_BIG_FIL_POST_REV_8_21_14_020_41_12]PJA62507.1 MAG: hypothetical protein CO162_00780 [bacterium (Candidatus Ratteibacteria) CG_4_9_14_3_um_filter_41_21]HCG77171.1 hypothetical protein [bacterium]